jgi:hypothetical protein
MPNGQTVTYTCPGDGKADVVRFDSIGAKGSSYRYVITDDKNIILATPGSDFANLEGAGVGVCRVWGLAYSGRFVGKPGQNATTTTLADGCSDLSDNFIVINRFKPNAGRVQMPNGLTTRYTCPGDGKADVVRFDSVGASLSRYAYVITDDKNVIIGLPGADFANVEGAGEGVCRVWGLAYTGNLSAKLGDNAVQVSLSDGCFDLSDNFIVINRFKPNAGRVQMPNGLTTRYTCPGDGKADLVRFDSVGASLSRYAYVITDDKNVIIGLPGADFANVEGAGEGVCRVWGLAYTGNLSAKLGDNAAQVSLSDDCFDLSDNFIVINRFKPNAGRVQMPNGLTTSYTCPGDGKADLVRFDSVGASKSRYAYVITDDQNVIIGLPGADFANVEGAGEGVCRVWGLAYTGNVIAKLGDNAAQVSLSDDCFDLSDNFIVINRFKPNAGTVSTANNRTEITTIAGDKIADTIRFKFMGASKSLLRFVVTDTNNVVLGLPPADQVDFEGAGPGVCKVWGLAYTGTLNLKLGDDIDKVNASNDCFVFSRNYVKVTRIAVAPIIAEGAILKSQSAFAPQLLVVPNPVQSTFRVDFQWSQPETDARIQVRDLGGRLVASSGIHLFVGDNQHVLDASDYPTGLLLLTIQTPTGSHSIKFLKVE